MSLYVDLTEPCGHGGAGKSGGNVANYAIRRVRSRRIGALKTEGSDTAARHYLTRHRVHCARAPQPRRHLTVSKLQATARVLKR